MITNRTMRRMKRYANHMDVDGVLDLIGLERRRSTAGNALPAIGMVVLGALIGASLGLLFAPRPGRVLRHDAEQKVKDIKERIRSNSPANPSV